MQIIRFFTNHKSKWSNNSLIRRNKNQSICPLLMHHQNWIHEEFPISRFAFCSCLHLRLRANHVQNHIQCYQILTQHIISYHIISYHIISHQIKTYTDQFINRDRSRKTKCKNISLHARVKQNDM
jgi:hypothetical protein